MSTNSSARKRNTGFVEKRDVNDAPEKEPFLPAPYDKSDVAALRALREGRAEPYQQQLALEWIIQAVCRTYDQPFRPGGEDGRRATDFALGKQSVGQQIVKLINMPADRKAEGEQG